MVDKNKEDMVDKGKEDMDGKVDMALSTEACLHLLLDQVSR